MFVKALLELCIIYLTTYEIFLKYFLCGFTSSLLLLGKVALSG